MMAKLLDSSYSSDPSREKNGHDSPASIRFGMKRLDGGNRFLAGLRKELFLAWRFALVGIVATLVHMLMVWALIELNLFPPLIANLIAFLTAFIMSFTGHYHWTFQRPGNPRRALKRLFLISSFGFAVNMLLLASLIKTGWVSDSLAAILAASVVPAIGFLASRFWGFKKVEEVQGSAASEPKKNKAPIR